MQSGSSMECDVVDVATDENPLFLLILLPRRSRMEGDVYMKRRDIIATTRDTECVLFYGMINEWM